jgi:hypothetical protein
LFPESIQTCLHTHTLIILKDCLYSLSKSEPHLIGIHSAVYVVGGHFEIPALTQSIDNWLICLFSKLLQERELGGVTQSQIESVQAVQQLKDSKI